MKGSCYSVRISKQQLLLAVAAVNACLWLRQAVLGAAKVQIISLPFSHTPLPVSDT
jgi:hypothetical protein